MEGFSVFNDRGELIIDSTIKNIGTVSTQPIGEIIGWYNSSVTNAPSWVDKDIGVTSLPDMGGQVPLTLLRPNDGACGCGETYYSKNAGDLIHLRNDYSIDTGYLDVFDADGNLIWSANSAAKVPRVTKVINVTAQQIKDGTSQFYIGNGCLMMNGLPCIMYPGPMGTLRVGGLFWRYTKSTGMLNVGWGYFGNAGIADYVQMAYGDVGLNLYIYEFGV